PLLQRRAFSRQHSAFSNQRSTRTAHLSCDIPLANCSVWNLTKEVHTATLDFNTDCPQFQEASIIQRASSERRNQECAGSRASFSSTVFSNSSRFCSASLNSWCSARAISSSSSR